MPVRKIINDPVHSFITINDDLVLSVINHPHYQRLRGIKQMAMAYLVYPGAVHTRFQHSLGAYHLVCLALQELQEKKIYITADEVLGTKLAILLHDIGHGPFSHALEKTLVHVHHEELSLLVMQKLNAEFNGQLDTAISIFMGKHPKRFLHQLVSSQLDADRLDYLARDSFFTGVSEGIIGYDRIIKMLTVHDGQLVVEEKGIHSIEKFLIARSLMYWQVYLHKTVLASETLLVKILERAKFLCNKGHTIFASPSLNFFLQNEVKIDTLRTQHTIFNHFIQLDDSDIFSAIKVWQGHGDGILADLSSRLVQRRLYKTTFAQSEEMLPTAQIAALLRQNLGVSEDVLGYYLVQGSTSNMAYNRVDEPIKILFKDGALKNINEIDNPLISSTLGNSIKKFYICHPALN